MNLRKYPSTAVCGVLFLVAALPARAQGIPVIDAANLANSIQQVQAWSKQAQDMVNQLNQLKQQFHQLQTMTSKLDGNRNLGTILNDPAIRNQLPPEMRDATQLLMNPAALATSQANINQMLSAFGIRPDSSGTANPAGQAAADTLGRTQQILASTQARSTQLSQLASRVDNATDAKESLDLMNRNVLEAASINNQMIQTMAALEAARKTEELKRIADDQAFFERLSRGAAAPLKSYSR